MASAYSFLCAWRDSNPHEFPRQILSLVRLPITPHAQQFSNFIRPLPINNAAIFNFADKFTPFFQFNALSTTHPQTPLKNNPLI